MNRSWPRLATLLIGVALFSSASATARPDALYVGLASGVIGSGTVEEFAPDGTPSLLASDISYPRGAAFGSSDHLYVANRYPNTPSVLDPSCNRWSLTTSFWFSNRVVQSGRRVCHRGHRVVPPTHAGVFLEPLLRAEVRHNLRRLSGKYAAAAWHAYRASETSQRLKLSAHRLADLLEWGNELSARHAGHSAAGTWDSIRVASVPLRLMRIDGQPREARASRPWTER